MNEPNDWVMCLDISSSCTGFALGTDGNLVKWGKYVPKGKKKEAEKLYEFSKWLSKTITTLPHKPTRVIIEQPYHKNNIRTYGVLSKYVAIAQREVFQSIGIESEYADSSSVKTLIAVKKGNSHEERKRLMVERVNHLYNLELKFHKSNKKITDDDIADAIAILHYTFQKTKGD